MVDETTTSWETLPQSAVARSHTFFESAVCSREKDVQLKPAKEPLDSKEATRRTQLDTGEAPSVVVHSKMMLSSLEPCASFELYFFNRTLLNNYLCLMIKDALFVRSIFLKGH